MPFTYILQCSDGSYYVGSTHDLDKRLKQHQSGQGCLFTKLHRPVKLIYKEEYETYQQAFARERQIHGWTRAKKEALIAGDIDKLKRLSKYGSAGSPFSFSDAQTDEVPELVEGEKPVWPVPLEGYRRT